MPLVSVVIPTYNRAPLLKYALESVMAQTFRDFEVIVVDDGSTDETGALVESYPADIRYVRLGHSGLPSVTRNAGLRVAQGDYIAFLDSDDQWLSRKLERQVAILNKCPNVGLVCSNALVLRNDMSEPRGAYLRSAQGRTGRILTELLKDNFVITSTVVARRALLNRVGIFSEDPLLRAVEDYDLWLRIAVVSELYYIPEALAIYRDDAADGVRSQQDRVSYWQGMLLILENLERQLRACGYRDAVPRRLINILKYNYRYELLKVYWNAAQYMDAASCGVRLIPQRPTSVFQLGCRLVRKSVNLIMTISENRRKNVGYVGKQGSELGSSDDGVKKNVNKGTPCGIRLHLGCGETYLSGYINIDFPPDHHKVQERTKADFYADIRYLSYPPESVEEIRLHHVFEHFDRATALRLLSEWYEWLKEGGRLIIESPDFERCVRVWALSRRMEEQLKVLRHIFGSHEAEWAYHYDGWYQGKFNLCLKTLGYGDLAFRYSEWRGTHNITVTAKKLRPFKTRQELRQAAVNLLRFSLIDDSKSEKQLLRVWMDEIERSSSGGGSHENPPHC